ncbi:MAG: HD domain-containing protein [Clostridiaceae bacterium]|nr:HD domain-containing protein [Clostridiaceae bacterium]
MVWRDIRFMQEMNLSPLAARTQESRGRRYPEEPCRVRSEYERDANRILYCEDFRRLRHKTQVFFNAKNDHICTRMEHVLYVNFISTTIGRTLGLNQDLITAIALGHDVGHAPFGHSGERALEKCLRDRNLDLSFKHEYHSLRVVDRLAKRISSQEKCGLNLTYEVRDGIVSHCGENYYEYVLYADRNKKMDEIYTQDHRNCMPYTLEACLVRLVDKIAYVGRDIEDAIRARIMDYNDISPEIRTVLGSTNAEIINNLVVDVIENSYGTEYIRLSDERGEALKEMILENNEHIYQSKIIKRYEKNAYNVIEGLFEYIYDAVNNIRNGEVDENNKIHRRLVGFMNEKQYEENEKTEQITVDYIAGMTDAYALSVYEEIYWI